MPASRLGINRDFRHDREMSLAPLMSDELSPADLRRVREALLYSSAEGSSVDSPQHIDRIEFIERLLVPVLCRHLGIFRIPPGFRLSVVIPVFNEFKTLARVIER